MKQEAKKGLQVNTKGWLPKNIPLIILIILLVPFGTCRLSDYGQNDNMDMAEMEHDIKILRSYKKEDGPTNAIRKGKKQMPLELEPQKGVLFPNEYKEEGDKKPHYTGEIELPEGYAYSGPKDGIPEGVSPTRLRIAIWDYTSKAGQPYRSVNVETPKPPKPKDVTTPKAPATKEGDDDLPF